jgi:hypothetical protein
LLINYELIAMEYLCNRFRVSDEPSAGNRQVKCIHSLYYRLHNVVNTNSKMLGVAYVWKLYMKKQFVVIVLFVYEYN